ncbi:MAG: LacI family DNA-binding transcriptional regulator [Chloroflexi bacterium]|nr:LacI family DNA-binding transcriptional regulator [Chloroflexota bacterium]
MATIKDVAARAGVSPSTVSYALSGKRPISDPVRRRIEAAIRELAFTPSALGRGLRQGSSRMIGVVLPQGTGTPDGLAMEFFAAAAAASNRAGYGLCLFTRPAGDEALAGLVRNATVDGLLLMEVLRHDPRVAAMRAAGAPFVLVGRTSDPAGLSLVDFDYEAAALLAFQHLAVLGHRVVGYLDDDSDSGGAEIGFRSFLRRGVERARASLPLTIVPRLVHDDGYAATCALLRAAPALTAIAALCGQTQLGALRALRDHGRSVPADCSLICITTAERASWSTPALSSIDLPLATLGRLSVELLLRQIAAAGPPEQIVLPPALVARETTAPPRQALVGCDVMSCTPKAAG